MKSIQNARSLNCMKLLRHFIGLIAWWGSTCWKAYFIFNRYWDFLKVMWMSRCNKFKGTMITYLLNNKRGSYCKSNPHYKVFFFPNFCLWFDELLSFIRWGDAWLRIWRGGWFVEEMPPFAMATQWPWGRERWHPGTVWPLLWSEWI